MRKSIPEPERSVPVRYDVDVLVCGGGVAGSVAALAAARQGARVAVIERHGFLGGTNTAAGVNGVGGWQYDLDRSPLVSGLPLEVMTQLAERGGADPDQVRRLSRPRPGGPDYRDGGLGCYWLATHPEYLKLTLEQMMEDAGVLLLYHALVCAPIMDGSAVRGAFVEGKSGREAILAKVVIDCTGDGDVAARAGAEFAVGRPGDSACQPMSTLFTAGGADVQGLSYKLGEGEREADPLVRDRYRGAVALARERGEIMLNPNDLFCSATPLPGGDPSVRTVNFTRVQSLDATDADDLTRAEMLGRRQAAEALGFMRKYVRGCADAHLISMPAQIGIRESRRILGEYVLTGDDVRSAADFPDAIARGIYLLDIHNPSEVGKPSMLIMLDAPYSIPYRCLVPRHVEGLLMAGRCISGDHVALASYRIQSHCMALGQAAGTAAALAAGAGCSPGNLDTDLLRRTLRESGANVGPDRTKGTRA